MDKTAEDIIVKFLSGNMSEQEKKLFEKQMADSDVFASEVESFRTVWQLTNQLSYAQDAVDASWHTFQEREVKAPKKMFGFDWLKVAASVTILAAFSAGMWFFGSTDVTFSTSNGMDELTMADETRIELNSNSILTYDKSYNDASREVSLSGQAYFDVTKSDKKFIVHAASGDVVVHGTQFTVFSDKSSGFTMVELLEGSVSFERDGGNQMLVPGQRLVIDEDGALNVEMFNHRSNWSEMIACDDVPLSYIMGQLKLTYGVDFKLSNRLLKQRYTVTLPKDDLSACIKILNDVSGKSFVLIDGTIALK